ncbi:MAG: PfkB family carbohydrate kinase, partial [Pyramidobacter porci]
MKPILFFGEALMDQFYDAAGELQSSLPGGSVLNAAVGAARLGLPTAFCGGIGGDEEGRALLRLLNREDIDHRFTFYKKDRATAAAQVRLTPQGQPAFAFRRAGCADESVTPDDMAGIDPNDFSGLHCGGVML